jgi:hypothetical protein
VPPLVEWELCKEQKQDYRMGDLNGVGGLRKRMQLDLTLPFPIEMMGVGRSSRKDFDLEFEFERGDVGERGKVPL